MKLGSLVFRIICCAFFVAMTGCANQTASNAATATPLASILPYQTPSATSTIAILVPGVTPSATPTIYIVQPNDTFFSIAARLKIDLNALIAANPDVDARVLLPGTELIVPVEGQIGSAATALPTLTPVAAQVSPVNCYSSSRGELWCFLLVVNDSDRTMENLIGEVILVSADGRVLASAQATPPLDVLVAGGRLPLVAYFETAPDGWAGAQGSLLTGFWLPEGDTHYLQATFANFDWQFGDTQTQVSANVRGTVQLSGSPNTIWVLAVAYDAEGKAVGFRRWESAGDLDFDFWVYSLVPKINDVEVLVEALP